MPQIRLQVLGSASLTLAAIAYVGGLSWHGPRWSIITFGMLTVVPAAILGGVCSKRIVASGSCRKAVRQGILIASLSCLVSMGISFMIYLILLEITGIGISGEACLAYLMYLVVPTLIVPLPFALPFGAIAGLVAYLLGNRYRHDN